MRTIIITLCALLMMAIPVKAEEMVLYDNFNSSLIEPIKWYGTQGAGRYDLVRELIRKIEGDKLRMALVGYSDTGSDTGKLWVRNDLRFPIEVAEKITALKAQLRVNHFHLMDCDSNPDSNGSLVRTRMAGIFFHDGNVDESGDPSDFRGDILVDIDIRKKIDDSGTSSRVLEVVARVMECLDYPCDYVDFLVNEPVRTIKRKQFINLGIEWDEANQGFIFQYGRQKDFVSYAGYYDPVFPAPSTFVKFVRVSALIPNCTSQPRPMYLMDASFDNVYVNESAVNNADGLD